MSKAVKPQSGYILNSILSQTRQLKRGQCRPVQVALKPETAKAFGRVVSGLARKHSLPVWKARNLAAKLALCGPVFDREQSEAFGW